jgi:hypothetical protein
MFAGGVSTDSDQGFKHGLTAHDASRVGEEGECADSERSAVFGRVVALMPGVEEDARGECSAWVQSAEWPIALFRDTHP